MGFEDRWVVRVAIRPGGARRFHVAQVLDPGAVKEAGEPGRLDFSPTAGIDTNGTATVVWAADDTAGDPPMHVPMSAVVRLSSRPVGGR